MNPNLAAALAAERQSELERAAGCCTPVAEHRRAMRRGLRERLATRRGRDVAQPSVCCSR